MFKRLLLAIMVLVTSWSYQASADKYTCLIEKGVTGIGDAFPMAFPWNQIEGYWELGSEEVIIRFKIIQVTENETRYLKVELFDRSSRELLAKGVEVARRCEMTVKALLRSPKGNDYRVWIQALQYRLCGKVTKEAIEFRLQDMDPQPGKIWKYELKKYPSGAIKLQPDACR